MNNNETQNNKQNIQADSPLIDGDNMQEPMNSNSDLTMNNTQNTSDSQEQTTQNTTTKARVYNIQNLTMYGKDKPVLSHEEAKKNGSKGGIKSGEVRKARKTMRETILEMLSKEISPEKLEEYGIDSADMTDKTYQSALIASMLREALNGSEKAMVLVRDTIGEQPTIRQEITETITHEDAKLMENLTKALTG